jgi:hypothetical protein
VDHARDSYALQVGFHVDLDQAWDGGVTATAGSCRRSVVVSARSHQDVPWGELRHPNAEVTVVGGQSTGILGM